MHPLPKTSNPATDAVNLIGIHSLEDLAKYTEKEIAKVHGVGPKAIRIWKAAMQEVGLKFKSS